MSSPGSDLLPDSEATSWRAITEAQHGDPFAFLGQHTSKEHKIWRIWSPNSQTVTALGWTFNPVADFPGAFIGRPDHQQASQDITYRLDNGDADLLDPYCLDIQIADFDLERLNAGEHLHLERVLGAQLQREQGQAGTLFSVWAPNAAAVSVIGEWNNWQANHHPMRQRIPSGVWEIFIPHVRAGAKYQFSILAQDGSRRAKCDPYARQVETAPGRAAIVSPLLPEYRPAQRTSVPPRAAMSIYEVHAASWRQHPDGSLLSYRELAAPLAQHARAHGFTHIEFLPLATHPLPASWGYQVTGQWAVDPRLGTPQDFSFLVEQLHAAGLGVLMDFVPGHFPKDDWALADFDGTPTYEYGDPREGEHRTWGTKVFNFRRPEVINFLTGAALYWLRTFGLDGLRIDAVSSMLYRNYDREEGEWIANEDGSSDNHDAITFLKHFTGTIRAFDPHVMVIAEESTAWPQITTPADAGGLGFHRKWNMGWMHDSLRYFRQDPVMRAGAHNDATFHQWYAYDEKWVLALSHDEVVHGKQSLLGRMPGDYSSQLAHLRLLMGWQLAVPGVPLLFMGSEFGQGPEWDALGALRWDEADQDQRVALATFHGTAQHIYRQQHALWQADDERDGFQWIDNENAAESIVAFLRQTTNEIPTTTSFGRQLTTQTRQPILVVANFTPVERSAYPLGVPEPGEWELILDSSDNSWGSESRARSTQQNSRLNHGVFAINTAKSGDRGAWGWQLDVDLPPLSMQWWRLREQTAEDSQ